MVASCFHMRSSEPGNNPVDWKQKQTQPLPSHYSAAGRAEGRVLEMPAGLRSFLQATLESVMILPLSAWILFEFLKGCFWAASQWQQEPWDLCEAMFARHGALSTPQAPASRLLQGFSEGQLEDPACFA